MTPTIILDAGNRSGHGSGTPREPRTPSPASAIDLAGMVLLVEDNLIIALDAEEMFHELGAARVEIAASVSEAFRLIDEAVPAFALLDLNLGSESSIPVAERLCELKVPVVFASGYGDTYDLPPKLEACPILEKPFTVTMLREALSGLVHT